MDDAERKQVYADVLKTLRWRCGQRRQISVEKRCENYFPNRAPELVRARFTEMVEDDCPGFEGGMPISWVGTGTEVAELTDDERAEALVEQITRDIFDY
jgi:hypothetical protein